jgi:hypothetical protein
VALEPGDVVVGNKVRGLLLKLGGFIKSRIEKVKSRAVEVETNGVKDSNEVGIKEVNNSLGDDDTNGIERDGNGSEKH